MNIIMTSAGTVDCISSPHQVLIPESLAKKLGTQDLIGKQIRSTLLMHGQEEVKNYYTIGGIYQDFPQNSSIPNYIYYEDEIRQAISFMLIKDPEQVKVIEEISSTLPEWKVNRAADYKLHLLPLEQYHFNAYNYGTGYKGNRKTMGIFLGIAGLILFIALINSINFAMAQIPEQFKDINTRKILGCSIVKLRLQFISRTIVTSLLAFLIALVIAFFIQKTNFHFYLPSNIQISLNGTFITIIIIIAVLIGIISGIYPAFYSTSCPPALALKGISALPSGKHLRKTLIACQYVIACTLIIITIFMNLQFKMFMHQELGFNKDNLIAMQLSPLLYEEWNVFRDKLIANPAITQVSYSSNAFFQDNFPNMKIAAGAPYVNYMSADPDFLSTTGIKLLEGRNFTLADGGYNEYSVGLITQSTKKYYNVQIGDSLAGCRIVGIISDFHNRPLRLAPLPILIRNTDREPSLEWSIVPWTYIRYQNAINPNSLIRQITEYAQKMDPDYSYSYNIYTFDDVMYLQYQSEKQQILVITFFGLSAILIALIGVGGLVAIEANYQKKEIGIRRIMGAEIKEILQMFNLSYIKMIIICFVIAAPLAYYITKQWIETFAFHIPLYSWVFALSLIIITFVTITVITLQSYKSATTNPVDTIKTE